MIDLCYSCVDYQEMTPIAPQQGRDTIVTVIKPRLFDPLLVAFIAVWSLVVGAVIAAIAWALSSVPFLPAFGVAVAVLVLWCVASSARNFRRYLRMRPPGWGGGWPDARGTRDPRPPRPSPTSSAAADPGESTGPSTIL